MRFEEITVQCRDAQPCVSTLCNHLTESVDAGRIAHASLLCGPASGGSLAVALAYVQYIYCENRQHRDLTADPYGLRADSCGVCPSCRKIEQLQHSDIHLYFPNVTSTETAKGLKSAADLQEEFRHFVLQHHAVGTLDDWYAFLGVTNQQGAVRESDADNIIKALTLKSYEGSYKTIIVWMAEKMNNVAANKLLKTLEEPTNRTLLILVTENTASLLPTILSRTQRIDIVDGSSQTTWPDSFGPLFVNWMRLLFKLNMKNLSDMVETLAGMGRETQKHFLAYMSEMVRQCMLHTMAGMPSGLHTGDARFDDAFPAMITLRNAEQIYSQLNEASYAIERNAAPKITFMQLSFTLSKLIKNR